MALLVALYGSQNRRRINAGQGPDLRSEDLLPNDEERKDRQASSPSRIADRPRRSPELNGCVGESRYIF